MKFCIITAAQWPTLEVKKRLWIFLRSCEWAMQDRQYPVLPYGMDERWAIYRHMKITLQLKHLKSELMRPYDTVLYSDGSDAFFTGPITKILNKYDAMDRPDILVSASHIFSNVSDEDKQYPGVFPKIGKYRFPQVGGWIGKKDAMIAVFEKMEDRPNEQKTSDDCFDWYDAARDGWFKPTLDYTCSIFQVTDEDCHVGIDERLQNTHTMTRPCVLHIAGGYHEQNPATGGGKDYAIRPWAEKLGIL